MDTEITRKAIAEMKGYYKIKPRWGSLTGLIRGQEDLGYMPIPDWTGDLNMAMRLVKDAEKMDVGFDLYNIHNSTGKITWMAAFYDSWAGPEYTYYNVEDENPALAIGLAFLKLMNGREVSST